MSYLKRGLMISVMSLHMMSAAESSGGDWGSSVWGHLESRVSSSSLSPLGGGGGSSRKSDTESVSSYMSPPVWGGGRGLDVASVASGFTQLSEEVYSKTKFLKGASPQFYRYNAPIPFEDGTIWLSFSPRAGGGPRDLTTILCGDFEQLQDQPRLGITIRELDTIEDVADVEEFLREVSAFVKATVSPQAANEEGGLERVLAIEGEISSRTLKVLRANPSILSWVTGLTLSKTNLHEALQESPSLEFLSELEGLEHIDVSRNHLTAGDIASLLEGLGERQRAFSLDLSHNPLGDAIIETMVGFFEQAERCRYLNFRNTGITDSFLEQAYDPLEYRRVLENPTPMTLDISANPVSEGALNKWTEAITGEFFGRVYFRSLLSYSGYQEDRELLGMIQKTLEEADDECVIRDVMRLTREGLEEIAQGLLSRPHIKGLRFMNCAFSGGDQENDRLGALSPVFTNGQLERLGFVNVGFSVQDAQRIYLALEISPKWCETLQELDLSRNFMGKGLPGPLRPVLMKARHLVKLNVAANALGHGASALVLDVMNHEKLEELNLQSNMMTDKEMGKLWRCLGQKKLPALKKIDVSYNPANHDLLPSGMREGLKVELKGLGMREDVLKAWEGHSNGAINRQTQSLSSLWAGMFESLSPPFGGSGAERPSVAMVPAWAKELPKTLETYHYYGRPLAGRDRVGPSG